MKVCDYIAVFLATHGVTDTFGIPGGVILDLLYAFDKCKGITPHLCYHEQAAGFAAIGFAQSSGRLGVAYATRGPGFTNLITAIAEAYCESLPVLFITGHTTLSQNNTMRVETDQEIDTCAIVKSITKHAYRVDDPLELPSIISKAYNEAMCGRKGPVLLDISSKVLAQDISNETTVEENNYYCLNNNVSIVESIKQSQRPVLLIGDGINQANKAAELRKLTEKVQIPVLSSRCSHDVLCNSDYYYGYIGSHGIRYANFVLSKADLILSIGNRLHFPTTSSSYQQITDKSRIIRIDIDDTEFERRIPNSQNIQADLSFVINSLLIGDNNFGYHQSWLEVCNRLKTELYDEDTNTITNIIEKVIRKLPKNITIVSDVGNNEFWLSRACVHSKYYGRVLYSKSFGSLGCGLAKAIGTYYATTQPVVCFTGDQGIQINIQELQYIVQNQLPILIVLINNNASCMIKDRETVKYDYFLHTTIDSGYSNPVYKKLSEAYGLHYANNIDDILSSQPCILEIVVDSDEKLTPSLPAGMPCQNMTPYLEKNKYEQLNNL